MKKIIKLVVVLIILLFLVKITSLVKDRVIANINSGKHPVVVKINKTKKNKDKNISSVMRTPIDYHKSSETVPYPNLNQVQNFWVKVSISKNRVYLMSGNKVIYTMYATAGIYENKNGKRVSTTPTGTFHIQQERGEHFYNSQLNEGANYYVSWLNHGEYLFHSVPTLANGQYNDAEAKKLGKTQGSHGCVRLSIPDAKWMMQNLKVGTKVVIEN